MNRSLSLPVPVLRFRFERFEIVGSQFLCLALFKASLFPFAFSVSFVLCSCQGPQASCDAMVGTSGLEPPTSRLSGVRSNLLSYAPSFGFPLRLSPSQATSSVYRNAPQKSTTFLQKICFFRFFFFPAEFLLLYILRKENASRPFSPESKPMQTIANQNKTTVDFAPRFGYNSFCYGGVAQLGERLLCTQEAIGSSPFISTFQKRRRSIRRFCFARLILEKAQSAAILANAPKSGILVQDRSILRQTVNGKGST